MSEALTQDFADAKPKPRPPVAAVIDRGELPKDVSALYDTLDTACDKGFRNEVYLHALRQLGQKPEFLREVKNREQIDVILNEAHSIDEPNPVLVAYVHELLDERYDALEQIVSDHEALHYLHVVRAIDAGEATPLIAEAPLAMRLDTLLTQAEPELFENRDDAEPFVPEPVVKAFTPEHAACTVTELDPAKAITVPLGIFVSATGFADWNGRRSDEKSHAKVEEYAKREAPGPEYAIPVVTVIVFEDGRVMAIDPQDGSHRLAAAFKRGDATVMARRVDYYFAKTA